MAQTRPAVAVAASGRAPSPATPGGDCPARAADVIESVVTTIRDRSVGPLEAVARVLVYGLLAALVSSVLLVLVAVAVVRVLVVYVPPYRAWFADVVLGGFFSLLGLILWSRRRPRKARAR